MKTTKFNKMAKPNPLKWNLRRPRTPADLQAVKRFMAKACEGYNYFIFSNLTGNDLLKKGFRTQKISIGHPESDSYYLFTYNWQGTYPNRNEDGKDPNFWLRVKERESSDYNLTFNGNEHPVGYPHLTLEAGVDETCGTTLESIQRDVVGEVTRRRRVPYSNYIGKVLIEPGHPVGYDVLLPLISPIYTEEEARWSLEVKSLVDAAWTANFLSRYVAKMFKK